MKKLLLSFLALFLLTLFPASGQHIYLADPTIFYEDGVYLKHNGTGHGDIFVDQKGDMRYVFHTHHSDTTVGPRKTAIVTLETNRQGGEAGFRVLEGSCFFPEHISQ